jgi:peptidylprolyl isomerase
MFASFFGMACRTIGEISKIVATPDYAYGASGFPAWGIMPNSDLAFEIEVLRYSYTMN